MRYIIDVRRSELAPTWNPSECRTTLVTQVQRSVPASRPVSGAGTPLRSGACFPPSSLQDVTPRGSHPGLNDDGDPWGFRGPVFGR